MTVLIESLDGHVIVAGWGRVGQSIAHYAQKVGSDVVVVDLLPSDGENDPPMVIGDANDDEVLIRAGIERASVLIAALSSDSDNLSLTLTARSLRPDIFLVARTSDQRHERKFFQAGANRVVNPYEIGGSRMGAVALQPSVAEFLDEVLHDESHDVHIHEVEVPEGSPLVGTEIGRITGGNGQPVMIAIRPTGDTYHANPASETVLGVGDVLIVLGTAAELKRLNGSLQRHKGLRYRGVGF